MSSEADRQKESGRWPVSGYSRAADEARNADSGYSAIGYEAADPTLQTPLWREEVRGAQTAEGDRS